MVSLVGVAVGFLVYLTATNLGLAAVFTAVPALYIAVKLAGAVYLGWLAVQALRGTASAFEATALQQDSNRRLFTMGLVTNLLNPKIGVFYLATIPQFVPADTSPLLMGVLLAAVHNVLGMAWFTVIILATGFAARWLARDSVAKITDRITGTVLVGFGAKLALDSR